MAFDATNWSQVSYGPMQVFSYKTTETDTTVEGANYFDDVAAIVNVGDVIISGLDTDGTPEVKLYVVSSNDGSTVAVTAMPIV